MIDLHAHILPKLDNSASTLADATAMVRAAMEDGIHTMVCTPRMGESSQWAIPAIQKRFIRFLSEVQQMGYPITLKLGADIDYHSDLLNSLKMKSVLTLNGSRYFLLRLPANYIPADLEETMKSVMDAGYVPIITHPERLKWISHHYHRLVALVKSGVWLQLTGDSLTGHLGRIPRYWAERLLEEGYVHVIATDAHSQDKREPVLSEAFNIAIERLGRDEAERLVELRAMQILENQLPEIIDMPHGVTIEVLAPEGSVLVR